MKSLLSIILIGITLILSGCGDAQAQRAYNLAVLRGPGQYIGTLPDGREVRAYLINNPESTHYHWLYVAGSDTTVNIPSGKAGNQVQAFIAPK